MEHWTEVARAVSQRSKSVKTDVQCKNRLDTLKKRYKQERLKPSSSWPYLTALDTILSSLAPKQQQQQQYHQHQQQQQRAIASSEAVAVADSVAVELLNSRPVKTLKHKLEWSDLSEDGEQPEHEQRWSKKAKKNPASWEEESCNELLRTAIATFGEIYERMVASKQQFMMELEKMRMQVTKDLEMQRMQIIMQTQVELAKLKYGADRNDRRT